MPGEPVLIVLFAGLGAALLSGLGALPFSTARSRPRLAGGAEALASGLMMGSGYLLMTEALDRRELLALFGAGLGVLYTYLVQSYAGTLELDPEPDDGDPAHGYKVLLQGTLHSASEGLAIGVAMVVDLRLGLLVAAALALHNVAEGVALSEVLRRRGMGMGEAAGLAIVTKTTQPLFALATFALAPVLERWVAGALGFAASCLLFLVLTELLPSSYRRASTVIIASLVTLSAAAVVLMEDMFR